MIRSRRKKKEEPLGSRIKPARAFYRNEDWWVSGKDGKYYFGKILFTPYPRFSLVNVSRDEKHARRVLWGKDTPPPDVYCGLPT